MRLTLRTLLAWLDDTLTPGEVREIGKQVAESPFAKELVEKIHRVTRQRRLTVPADTGQDATDPALVARYLDNELDPDDVAELEKKCLVSDVHLAEVASVHQILSLIGQKAKVPTAARHRMYQLIKGREAVKPSASRASRQKEPVAPREQAQPWLTAAPPARPVWEHYGPAAAVIGLMAVLALTAWKTLSTPAPPLVARVASQPVPPRLNQDEPAGIVKPEEADKDAKRVTAPGAPDVDKPRTKREEQPPAPKTEGDGDAKPAVPESPDDPSTGAPAVAAVAVAPPAAGSVGSIRKPSGVILKFNPGVRAWERVSGAIPLREQDRLLSLEPFRTTLEMGTAAVDLVGATEVWAKSTPPTQAARLTLAQGRAVLHGTAPSLPFEVQFAGRAVRVTPPPGGRVGVERLDRRPSGSARAFASVLRFFAADGPTRFDAGPHTLTVEGAGAVTVETDGTFSDETSGAPPGWVTENEPVPYDQERGEEFLKILSPDRPLMTSLVEASEDDEKKVSRLAISALYALGDISMVVPLLNNKSGASASARRKAAIAASRAYLGHGPEALRELRVELNQLYGDEMAATAEKLLVGYSATEAADEATYTNLVQILGGTDPTEVGVRELALDNLMELTGRSDLDYNPEKPTEGKGLKAWRDLLHAHELRPPASSLKPSPPPTKNATPKALTPKTGAGKAAAGKAAAARGATAKGEERP